MQWFLELLPVGLTLLIIATLISYYLYKPGVTHSSELASWANTALDEMGKLTCREYTLIVLVLLSLSLWVFCSKMLNATVVCLLAVSLMMALQVVSCKDITKYSSSWNTMVNLATLVVMANGLTGSGFIDCFARTMSTPLDGFSPNMAVVALVLVILLRSLFICQFGGAYRQTATVDLGGGQKGCRVCRWNSSRCCWCSRLIAALLLIAGRS